VKKVLAGIPLAVVSLLLYAAVAQAQATPQSSDYTGPRFPGGPDSLRAFVYRSTQQNPGTAIGQRLLELKWQDNHQPNLSGLVGLPHSYKQEPTVAMAMQYLRTHMPAWEPGVPDTNVKPGNVPKTYLVLNFTRPLSAQPYAYADQNPTSPDPIALAKTQRKRRTPLTLDYSPRSLVIFIQRQVMYPSAAVRQNLQGVVYAYFEIAENGAIEHPTTMSAISEVFDDEVLRVLKQLPKATGVIQNYALGSYLVVLPTMFPL
jgi:hypothetical protein